MIMTFKCLRPGEDAGYPETAGVGERRDTGGLGIFASVGEEDPPHPHSVPGRASVPHLPESSHHLLQALKLLLTIPPKRKWRLREGKSLA